MAFVRNTWYCAGWSSEFEDKPIHRKILGEDLVLFRAESGKVAALNNKCPHRFAPMHKGKITGEAIECPYHGLQFNHHGKCVFNPHGSGKIPEAAKLDSYLIEERDGTVWIWMGYPEKADPNQVVDTTCMTDPKFFSTKGGYHLSKSNYLLVVDNLLDLTHTQYLHAETVGGTFNNDKWDVSGSAASEEAAQQVWFEEDDNSMTCHYKMLDRVKPPLWDPIIDYERGDLHSWITWYPASSLHLTQHLKPSGADDSEITTMIALHFITPIDEMTAHYFFAGAWDAKIDNVEAGNAVGEIINKTIFLEDGPMIDDCQYNMGDNTDFFSLAPVLLETDGVAVKARRWVEELVEDEQEAVA